MLSDTRARYSPWMPAYTDWQLHYEDCAACTRRRPCAEGLVLRDGVAQGELVFDGRSALAGNERQGAAGAVVQRAGDLEHPRALERLDRLH